MGQYHFIAMGSRRYENSPVVIQEAVSAGRPLIVPAHGGMKEKTEGLNVEFAPSNPDSLAGPLTHLSVSSYSNLQVGLSARRHAMKDECAKKYSDTFIAYVAFMTST